MFLGEFSCLIVFHLLRCRTKRSLPKESEVSVVPSSSRFNPIIFLAPALCDLTATSIMNIGLNLTYASSFQMLRGKILA